MKKEYGFTEILETEKGKALIETIEELHGEKEPALVRIRQAAIKDLETEYGWKY